MKQMTQLIKSDTRRKKIWIALKYTDTAIKPIPAQTSLKSKGAGGFSETSNSK